jgi:hypothetical protein
MGIRVERERSAIGGPEGQRRKRWQTGIRVERERSAIGGPEWRRWKRWQTRRSGAGQAVLLKMLEKGHLRGRICSGDPAFAVLQKSFVVCKRVSATGKTVLPSAKGFRLPAKEFCRRQTAVACLQTDFATCFCRLHPGFGVMDRCIRRWHQALRQVAQNPGARGPAFAKEAMESGVRTGWSRGTTPAQVAAGAMAAVRSGRTDVRPSDRTRHGLRPGTTFRPRASGTLPRGSFSRCRH